MKIQFYVYTPEEETSVNYVKNILELYSTSKKVDPYEVNCSCNIQLLVDNVMEKNKNLSDEELKEEVFDYLEKNEDRKQFDLNCRFCKGTGIYTTDKNPHGIISDYEIDEQGHPIEQREEIAESVSTSFFYIDSDIELHMNLNVSNSKENFKEFLTKEPADGFIVKGFATLEVL